MIHLRLFRPLGRILIGAAVSTAALPALAQTPPATLDSYVITATRTPRDPWTLGTAVQAFSSEELSRRQITALGGALAGVAAVPVAASGGPGSAASVFLRGANSNQTLFLVDGIRMNDPNTDYQLFLGGASLGAGDRLEVSYGPQSTLYGGEAVGGVIALRAQRGEGAPASRLVVEGGSFGTIQGAASTQGEEGAWRYALSVAGGHTDNDRPNNAFDRGNLVARVDRIIDERLTVGATLRGFRGVYGSPGTVYANDPDNEERESNWLGTVFARFEPTDAWTSRVTVGGQERRFVSDNPGLDGGQVTVVTNRRAVLDAQMTYAGLDRHRLTAGLTAERNHTRNQGFGDIDQRQSLLAFFLQDEFSVTETVQLTGGFRSDDHDTFGRATTGRLAAAWQVVPRRLKLRASYGTAFRSPSFLDLYGTSAFYVGNPNLKAERANGWDAGVDYALAGERGLFSLTWFDTRFRDLIAYDFGVFPGTTANVARARTQGLELTGKVSAGERTELRLSYTYLEADDLTDEVRLLRRPRHTLSVDVLRTFAGNFEAGVGLLATIDREDVHGSTFGRIDAEDYTVVRVYASWAVRPDLRLRARIENAFDESYAQVHGYPLPGLGGFAGVEWTF